MNIIDAAYATVHDYQGGSESLGPRVGISAAVLRNKVNPGNGTYRLSIAEADRIMGLTGDFRMLRALAHQHGFLLIKAPDPDASVSDREVLEQRIGPSVPNGELMRTAHVARADGEVSEKEFRATRAAEYALQRVAATVTQRMESRAARQVSR